MEKPPILTPESVLTTQSTVAPTLPSVSTSVSTSSVGFIFGAPKSDGHVMAPTFSFGSGKHALSFCKDLNSACLERKKCFLELFFCEMISKEKGKYLIHYTEFPRSLKVLTFLQTHF